MKLNMGPPVMDNRPTITWTKPMREKFRKEYKKNIDCEKFEFDGHEYLTKFAKYLLEYLDMKL